MSVTILQGNNLETLKQIEPGSVRCVVTSPPYYGLRDYGTAQWIGGSPECDHRQIKGGNGASSYINVTNPGTQNYQYRGVCPKCGAVRTDEQIGMEETPEAYIQKLVDVFRLVRDALSEDGNLWLNLGDSYAGSWGAMSHDIEGKAKRTGSNERPANTFKQNGLKPKDLMMIPARVALALQADGWYLRSEIVWHKPNPMPESVKDRPTRSHEMIYLLTKSEKYYYDYEAILEPGSPESEARLNRGVSENHKNVNGAPGQPPHSMNAPRLNKKYSFARTVNEEPPPGQPNQHRENREDIEYSGSRNKRDVWTVTTKPYSGAHFATFPPDLIEPCILAGTSAKGHCPACGAPWERVTEKPSPPRIDRPAPRSKLLNNDSMSAAVRKNGDYMNGPEIAKWREENPTITLGWKPTCKCNAGDPVPDVVLDPFGGSGTTAAVAIKHNRKAILCELNPEYIKLINERVQVQPYFPMELR